MSSEKKNCVVIQFGNLRGIPTVFNRDWRQTTTRWRGERKREETQESCEEEPNEKARTGKKEERGERKTELEKQKEAKMKWTKIKK